MRVLSGEGGPYTDAQRRTAELYLRRAGWLSPTRPNPRSSGRDNPPVPAWVSYDQGGQRYTHPAATPALAKAWADYYRDFAPAKSAVRVTKRRPPKTRAKQRKYLDCRPPKSPGRARSATCSTRARRNPDEGARITVKKDREWDEWMAVWYDGRVKNDAKTYYAGGGNAAAKQDAIDTAKVMARRAGIPPDRVRWPGKAEGRSNPNDLARQVATASTRGGAHRITVFRHGTNDYSIEHFRRRSGRMVSQARAVGLTRDQARARFKKDIADAAQYDGINYTVLATKQLGVGAVPGVRSR